MYKPKDFKLYELMPKDVFDANKDNQDKLWMLWRPEVLYTAQRLRDRFGKMICNTWYWGGVNQYRGWRPEDCPVGAEWSMHKWFGALDLIPMESYADQIRTIILNDPFHEDFKYITCLEMNISWLHFDCRNWNKDQNGILKIYP